MRITEYLRGERRLQSVVARYGFSLVAVATALALRLLLEPFTGRGAPFVIFFAATLFTSLVAGPGPTFASLLISVPLAGAVFIVPAGYPISQVVFQAALYLADGLIAVYLTLLLKKQRERFRETIELAPDAYFLADLNARYTAVNPAACKLLGYERDELIGKQIFDTIPAEDAVRLEAQKQELLVPGAVSTAEWTLIRKDGTRVPTEVSANILPDGRWQAFVRDISEARRHADERERLLATEQRAREQAESAIAQMRESEERFRLTIANAPIGMALVGLDGKWVRVNQALCELTGYSADELTKLTFQDITHPDDLAKDVELLGQLARAEIPRYQLEKRYIRKDRSAVDIMLSVSALRGADGAARYYIAQIEDISVRKQAEEAIRLSEAKFSGIVSIAADAIISVDENQRITLFNEGAEQIFGYTRSEVMGTPLERLLPERFRTVHGEHFERFARGEEDARKMGERQDIFGLRKSGQEFPAEASISKVSVGGATFFSVVLRDMTYRKSVEAALQRAVSARDEVLGIVAHDLRNPLNTIMLQAQLLERPGPEPERRDQTVRLGIMRSAHRMNHLIQDLLDVATIEAGQLKLERDRISAADLAREAMEGQKAVAAASRLELELDVAPEVPNVWADRNRLLQVFENLIGNAFKFTQEGGRITIAAVPRDDAVEFSVSDTGCGIAPEALPHVFDRFWQAATRAARLGAGLGLPITRGIVEAHGGRIWVESTVDRGSTFYFTVPLAPVENARPGELKLLGKRRARSLEESGKSKGSAD